MKEINVKKSIVESIAFDLRGDLTLSLKGFPYSMFVSPNELHYGGKNCEISQLVVGSKIKFETSGCEAVRQLYNVTVMSDGIREVDDDGNLVKW